MHTKIVKRYANALLDAAVRSGFIKEVTKDAYDFIELYNKTHELQLFFKSPVISIDKKTKVLEELFGKKVNLLSLNFYKILVRHKRESIIKEILNEFINLKNESDGIMHISIQSSIELNKNSKAMLISAINEYSGMKCEAEYSEDRELIGGFKIRVGDEIIDASLKRQIENLKNELLKSQVK